MRRMLGLLVVLVGLAAGRVDAAVIFSDNFDGENGGVADASTLNYTVFANFTVSNGSVDLIGNGYFDFLPGNGLYIDLDGSTGDAGVLTESPALALAAGSYTLSFDLAGNQRGGTDSILVKVFGSLDPNYITAIGTFAAGFPFTNFSVPFQVLVADPSVQFSFANAGGDNIGLLLDNVLLADDVQAAPVPEPASLLLLGGGLVGLCRRMRRKVAR